MQRKRLLFLISAVIALVAVAAFAVLWIGARTQLARGVVAGWITRGDRPAGDGRRASASGSCRGPR